MVQAEMVDWNPFLLSACLITGSPPTLKELVAPTVAKE